MMQAAKQALQLRDFQRSIEILERANRLNPANPDILLQLGSAHGRRYDYVTAEGCFEKAIRFASKKTEVLAVAGRLCRDFSNYDMAERYLQRAAEQNDAPPETFVQLAEIYERFHRLEDAVQLVDRALHLNGTCAQALLAKARLDRQTGRLAEAENRLRPLLAQFEPDIRVRGWYELGGILDRQKRYDEAMTAFLEAKALLRPYAAKPAFQRQMTQERLKAMQGDLTAEALHRWFDFAQTASLPPRRLALLGGHPRSGTTLLEQVLDAHLDIVSAEEAPIFYDDACSPLQHGTPKSASSLSFLESATADMLRASRERYFRSMELFLGQPIGDRLLLDKNPSLTFFIPVLIRVFPEIKFLVALRDPRDVVLSCFMLPLVPINQTACAYLSLESTVQEYSILMGIWRTATTLMKNPYLEVRYEDMVEDLESVARKTLHFLGVTWDERVLRFDEHARQKLVRSPTYADVTKPVFKSAVGRWRNYQKYLEPCLEKLAPFLKAFGY
jgi:tetratricopeptide (TPR) repeat protein